MEKNLSARRMTGTEELLSVMSNEELNPETKKSHKSRWQQIFMTCICVFTIAAAAKGFLYVDTEIGTVQYAVASAVKDLNTLKAQVTATDTKEELATVTAEVENLKVTNTQLRAEVREIREAFDTFKTRKGNVVPTQRKRR